MARHPLRMPVGREGAQWDAISQLREEVRQLRESRAAAPQRTYSVIEAAESVSGDFELNEDLATVGPVAEVEVPDSGDGTGFVGIVAAVQVKTIEAPTDALIWLNVDSGDEILLLGRTFSGGAFFTNWTTTPATSGTQGDGTAGISDVVNDFLPAGLVVARLATGTRSLRLTYGIDTNAGPTDTATFRQRKLWTFVL